MKTTERLQKYIVIYTAISFFAVAVTVAFAIANPFYNHLKKSQDEYLVSAVKERAASILQYLSRINGIAAQIANRGVIREKLEAYNRGGSTLDELTAFSAPKLLDAIKYATEVVGVVRFDKNQNPVVQVGLSIPKQYQQITDKLTDKPTIRGPLYIGTIPYMPGGLPSLRLLFSDSLLALVSVLIHATAMIPEHYSNTQM